MSGSIGCFGVAALLLAAGCSAPAQPDPQFELLEHPAASMVGALGTDLLVDPHSGDLLATWVAPVADRDALLFSRSADHGASWSPAVVVSSAADSIYTQEESVPVLTASAAGIAIAYGHVVPSEGTPWALANVRVTRSIDGGATWLAGTTVNSDTTGPQAGHQFQGVTTAGARGLVAAWLDTRKDTAPPGASGDDHEHSEGGHSGSAKLYWVRSDDFGASWGENRQAGAQLCDCCRVSLAAGANGEPLATWRQAFPGSRRETVVAPLDTAIRPPTPVHLDDWEFDGCPDAGPESAVDAEGVVHVVWYTGAPGRAGIWYARSKTTSVGDGFGAPVAVDTSAKAPISRVAIALRSDGSAGVVYDRRPDFSTGLFYATIDANGLVTRRTLREGQIRRPEIAGVRGGGVILSWTEEVAGGTVVRYGAVR